MSYTTAQKVVEITKSELVSADIQDYWLVWADAKINATTGKVYTETTITDELHDGSENNYMFLDHYPITSLTAVSIDDTAQDLDNMWYETNVIGFLVGTFSMTAVFTTGFQNVSISYKHGDVDMITIAQETATLIVAIRALQAKGTKSSGGLISEKLDKYTIKYGKAPYAGMIDEFNDQIDQNYDLLGRRISYGVI